MSRAESASLALWLRDPAVFCVAAIILRRLIVLILDHLSLDFSDILAHALHELLSFIAKLGIGAREPELEGGSAVISRCG
jgi:hypothetical protein